jgi:ABC-type transport system involved in multi-copper enzyme maturation permease subunit
MIAFKILLRHDLHRLVGDRRFYVIALLLAGLIAAATSLRSSEYKAVLAQDMAEAARNEGEIERTGELNRLYDLAPPQVQAGPLGVFHQGVPLTERAAGTTESDLSESAFNTNPLLQVFPPFDLANIVLLVLGLVVLLTSSLTLTGEREAGTFEMLLVHGVSRLALVMAKWLAVGIAATLLLLPGMTVALLIALESGFRLTHVQFRDLVLSAGCSALFLLCLAALGTLISARSTLRTQSLISASGLWMLIAIVLPSAGAYVAASIAPLKDLGEKRRAMEKILTDDREAALGARIAKLYEMDNAELERFLQPAGFSAEKFRALADKEADALAQKLASGNPAFADFVSREQGAVIEIIQTTWSEHSSRAEKIEAELQASIGAQNNLILMFTACLPATAYRESLSRAFGFSYADLLHARVVQKEYKRTAVEYIFRKARIIGGMDPFNQRVDLSDRPRFKFSERAALERWYSAAPFILVMVAWTVVALLLAVRATATR